MTTIFKPAELNFLGATARILASGEALGLVHMDMPAGEMPPLHLHRNEDEGFYVLGGDLRLFLPGDAITLRPGEFFLAPRGIPHAYEVGPDGARVLVSSAPSGFERFVAEVAELEAVDPATLTAVAATHGIDILGPPGTRP
jgi:quercetin dioxygenase-like cupin family protein